MEVQVIHIFEHMLKELDTDQPGGIPVAIHPVLSTRRLWPAHDANVSATSDASDVGDPASHVNQIPHISSLQ